jgi:hypothetical protein
MHDRMHDLNQDEFNGLQATTISHRHYTQLRQHLVDDKTQRLID